MAQASAATVGAAMREQLGPIVVTANPNDDPVGAIFVDQLRNPPAPPMGPDLPFNPVDLGPKTTMYRFRSKGKHRLLGFLIPIPTDSQVDWRQEHEQKVFKRRFKDVPERNRLVKLAERNGGRMVWFTPVPRKFECFLATDDADLAAWLRQRPEFGGAFYEEMGPVKMTLPTGQVINVVPQTDADRQALAAARATA